MNCACNQKSFYMGKDAVDYVEHNLVKVREHPSTWNILYQCPSCRQYWEIVYAGAGEVCCVEPELHLISGAMAAEEYGAD